MKMNENPRLIRNCLGALKNLGNSVDASYHGCKVQLQSTLNSNDEINKSMDRHILEGYQFHLSYPFSSTLNYEKICTILFKAVKRSFSTTDSRYEIKVAILDSKIIGESLSIELKIMVYLENINIVGNLEIEDPNFLRVT